MTFLRKLAVDQAKDMTFVESESRVKVSLLASSLDNRLRGKEERMSVTLTFFENTGNIQVQVGAALEDEMKLRVASLEFLFCRFFEDGASEAFPDGASNIMQGLMGSDWEQSDVATKGPKGTFQSVKVWPEDPAYDAAIQHLAAATDQVLSDHPVWRDKLQKYLREEMGLGAARVDFEMPAFDGGLDFAGQWTSTPSHP